MRNVLIGDLHCREIWKKIVEKESDADRFILLGDYTCPRGVKYDDPTDADGFLYEVLDFKDKNPNKVILIRGNHCMDSLGYYWARCYPQDHPKVRAYWQTDDVKNWYLNNTQWVYRIPNTNIVCSHAGCSKVFLDNANKVLKRNNIVYYSGMPVPYSWIIDNLNKLEPSELFGFTDNSPFDTDGESSCQPCTWIRPWTLSEYMPADIIQVVGHTPVTEHIFEIKGAKNSAVWCCDALGLENPEYLVIDNGEFKICKVYDNL